MKTIPLKRLRRIGFLGSLLLLAAAGGLLVLSWGGSEAAAPGAALASPPRIVVDKAPIRGEFRPLRLRRTGFEYRCTECHQSIAVPTRRQKLVAEHTDLVLNHGTNDFCLNCHHPSNRDVYTDHDGRVIPAEEPARLCGKCHGLVYRDWLNDAHGRAQGGWDAAQVQPSRLLCIQCHDPHNPKFPAMPPMPGPAVHETIKSGDTHHGE